MTGPGLTELRIEPTGLMERAREGLPGGVPAAVGVNFLNEVKGGNALGWSFTNF